MEGLSVAAADCLLHRPSGVAPFFIPQRHSLHRLQADRHRGQRLKEDQRRKKEQALELLQSKSTFVVDAVEHFTIHYSAQTSPHPAGYAIQAITLNAKDYELSPLYYAS